MCCEEKDPLWSLEERLPTQTHSCTSGWEPVLFYELTVAYAHGLFTYRYLPTPAGCVLVSITCRGGPSEAEWVNT